MSERGGMQAKTVRLHGHRMSYRTVGSGPVLVLIHGTTGSSRTWEQVLRPLAERHTVVAPDLLGHGDSAKPQGDYSLGAYASGVRDLLAALGHERATVAGHSLGGGIALQFAYQFPELCDRLVLVSSGGLGREVHWLLRAATLPGAEWVLPLLAAPGLLNTVGRPAGWLGRVGLTPPSDLREVWRGWSSLSDTGARHAFLHTLRSVADPGGQRVSAADRLYLAADVPTLLVWGERDPIIPVAHARDAHAAMPGSALEIFERSGHFPHLDEPARFARTLLDFIDATEPAQVAEHRWRELLSAGAGRQPRRRAA